MSDLEGFLKQILGDRQNERPELVTYLRKMDEDAKKYPNEPVLVSKTAAEDVNSHFRSLEGVGEQLLLVENLGLMYFPEKGTIAIGTRYACRGDEKWHITPEPLKLQIEDVAVLGNRAKTSFTGGCTGMGREVVVAQSGCEVFFGHDTIERYLALTPPGFSIGQNSIDEDKRPLGERYPDTALMFSYARALRQLGIAVPAPLEKRYNDTLVKQAQTSITEIARLACNLDHTRARIRELSDRLSESEKITKFQLGTLETDLHQRLTDKVKKALVQEWVPLNITVRFAAMNLIPQDYLTSVVKTYNIS